jgi:thioredoxin reductase (NADPH)
VALGAGGRKPRLLFIDRTYNLPGYPEGIPGRILLSRLREQAEEMGGTVLDAMAQRVEKHDDHFHVQLSDGKTLRARTVLLAMGVRDRCPDISNAPRHEGQFLRYCPVCDGYEHTNKQLGILGSGGSVARHALFLQTFSNRIAVFLHGKSTDTLGRYRDILKNNDIAVYEPRVMSIIEGPPEEGETHYTGCGVRLEDGSEHKLAVLYGALGCELHLESVANLGLELDDDGYVVTNINQETSVPGIYAAGDVTNQINQIAVAFGQATVAAVRIHNALDDEEQTAE